MNKKIIGTFLGLSLFLGQSGILALDNEHRGNTHKDVAGKNAAQTEQEKEARKKREKVLVKHAKDLYQKLVQGKATEHQILESIYVWRDGIKDPDSGEIVRQLITPQEANFLIGMLDLQDLHEKKQTINELMKLKAQADQKKISKQWFKRCALKILFRMCQRGLITRVEMEKIKQNLGLVSISQRVYSAASAGLSKAIKVSLAIGAVHCLSNFISHSKKLPELIKALTTGEAEAEVEFFDKVGPGVFKKVVLPVVAKIGFWDKLVKVAEFVFGINESASGALNRTGSLLH